MIFEPYQLICEVISEIALDNKAFFSNMDKEIQNTISKSSQCTMF